MTQQIDPVKLKAAAEHLEWVCQQYPNEENVRDLYQSLLAMIEDAKAGLVVEPIKDRQKIPGAYNFAEGLYQNYINPNVGDAYTTFSTEMKGGLTDLEKSVIEMLRTFKNDIEQGDQS